MERLELQLSPQEKELVWKAVDLNSDGHLNYLEFCAAFQVSWGVVCLVFFSPFGILCGVSGLLAVWFFGVVYTHWLARAHTHTHTHTHTHKVVDTSDFSSNAVREIMEAVLSALQALFVFNFSLRSVFKFGLRSV